MSGSLIQSMKIRISFLGGIMTFVYNLINKLFGLSILMLFISTSVMGQTNIDQAWITSNGPDIILDDGGGTHTLIEDISVTGNWTNNLTGGNTFDNGGYKITYSGSSDQNIGGTTSTIFDDVEINNSTMTEDLSTHTINGTLTITDSEGTTGIYIHDQTIPIVNVEGGLLRAGQDTQDTSIGDITITGGTFESEADIVFTGDWDKTGGTFTTNSDFHMYFRASGGATQTITGTTTFHHLDGWPSSGSNTIDASAATITVAGQLNAKSGTIFKAAPYINGALLIDSGGEFEPSGDFTLAGDFTNNGTYDAATNTAKITFDGGSDQDISVTTTFYDVELNNSSMTEDFTSHTISGTLTITSGTANVGANGIEINAVNVNGGSFAPGQSGSASKIGDLTITTGTLDASNGEIDITGDWTKSGGTFTTGTRGVRFKGSGTQNITGSTTFYTLAIQMSGDTDITDAIGEAIDVSNYFEVTTGVFKGAPTVSNIEIKTDGTLELSADITNSGNWNLVSGGVFTPGTYSVEFTGASATITGATSFYDLEINNGSNNINVSAHTVTNELIVTAGTITGGTTYNNININGGTFALSAATSFSGDFALSSGTFTQGGYLVTMNGTAAQAMTGSLSFSNLTINNTHGSAQVDASGASSLAVTGSLTITDGDFKSASDYNDVSIAAAGTLTLTGDITVSGDWANSGTLTGNFEVQFDGSDTQNITGSTTFYNLEINNSHASNKVVASTATVIVSNEFLITDGIFSGAPDLLNATISSSAGTLELTGNIVVSGNWSNTSGNLTGNFEVEFDGASSTITGATGFYNLEINNASNIINISAHTVSNLLTITAGSVTGGTDYVSVTITGGTFVLSGNTTISGEWTRTGGSFTPGSNKVTFDGSDTQTITGTNSFYDLTIANTHSSNKVDASTGSVTVTNDLAVTDGIFLSSSDYVNVTISSGATLELSGNITVSGDWTNNGTFTQGTYLVTLDGSGGQTFTGTVSFVDLTITNSGITDIDISGITITDELSITDGPVVTGAQSIPVLTLSSNGELTNTSAATTSFGSVTITGGSFTLVEDITVTGNWNKTGGTFTGNYEVLFDVNGTTDIDGSTTFYNLEIDNGHATQKVDASGSTLVVINILSLTDGIFLSASDYEDVNITSGATLELSGNITVSGDWTNNGTFTHGGFLVTFDGTSNLLSSAASTFDDVTIAGSLTLAENMAVEGTWTNNGTFGGGSNTVTLNGSSQQSLTGSGSTTFYNLTLNNSNGAVLGIGQAVTNTLTLTSGILTLGNFDLTFGDAATAVAGTLSSSNMVAVTGTGSVIKEMTGVDPVLFLFPIGETSVTTEYSPFSVDLSGVTYGGTGHVEVNVTDTQHGDVTGANYLSRYWTVTESNLTAFTADVVGNYLDADINGTESLIYGLKRDGGASWTNLGLVNTGANTFSGSGLITFSDFTGGGVGVTLTSPNGGERYLVNRSENITWTYFNVTNVKLEYSTDNGSTWVGTPIVASTAAAAGTYSWTIPSTLSNLVLVRVSDASNPTAVNDVSDVVFTIADITVTSPNGAEFWEVASSQSITWDQSDLVTEVQIEYSTNNGGAWIVVDPSETVSGTDDSFSWTIPNTPTEFALVRVTALTGGTGSDVSDAVFTIPGVIVVTPNGGEAWVSGTSEDITYLTPGYTLGTEQVTITYSTDNGGSWLPVSTPVTGGSYSWTVSDLHTYVALVKIKRTAGTSEDESDAVFTIKPPPPPYHANSPANFAVGVTLEPNLEWDAVTNAVTYEMQLGTDTGWGPSAIVVDTSGILAASPRVVELEDYSYVSGFNYFTKLINNTGYFWRLRTIGLNTVVGDWSTPRKFTTVQNVTPALTNPLTGSELTTPVVPFYWSVDVSYENLFFDLYVNTTGVFTQISTLTPIVVSGELNQSGSGYSPGVKHYWLVRSRTSENAVAGYSTIESFITNGVLSPVTLIYPYNGITTFTSSPYVYWANYTYSPLLQYQVRYSKNSSVDGDNALDTDFSDAGLTFSSYTQLSSLDDGATYYWQVGVTNDGGSTYVWSDLLNFVTPSNNSTLIAPSPTYPGGGSVIYSTSSTFYWTPQSYDPTMQYQIRYSTSNALTSGELTTGTTSGLTSDSYIQVAGLTGNTTYYWQVRAYNGSSFSPWSAYQTFLTDQSVEAVKKPIQLYPADGQLLSSLQPTLYWLVNGYSSGYDFTIVYNNDGAQSTDGYLTGISNVLGSGATGGLFATFASALTNGEIYYWQVIAATGGADSAYSAIRSFTVNASVSDGVQIPIPTTPYEGAVVSTTDPAVHWNVNGSYSHLEFEVLYATDNTVSSGVLQNGTALTSWTGNLSINLPDLVPGATYYWQVRSRLTATPATVSSYSAVHSFTVSAGAEPVMAILGSPIGGVEISTNKPTLSWVLPTSSESTLSYELEISDNAEMNSAEKITGLENTKHQSDLAPGKTYYWRVRSRNSEGAYSYYTGASEFAVQGSVTATEEEEALPTEFSIDQNYPNPFNPTTTIKFGLPEAGKVRLTIYNILGEQIKTLVNEELNAGYHRIQWNGENNNGSKVVSGAYLYKIESGINVISKKMLLIK